MQEQVTKKRGPRAKKTETQEMGMEEKIPQAEPAQQGTFTLEQVQKMIEEALAKRESSTKEVVAVSEPLVTMRFQDEVNDRNVIELGNNGKFGQITGKFQTVTVQKRDFIGEFRTNLVQNLLRDRKLIVIDGLTDEERKIYGVDYRQGECLEPAVYDSLINMGDEILDVFPRLSISWKEMVASKFAEAYEKGELKVKRETLLAMNKISQKDYASLPKNDQRRKGAFYEVIHRMNLADESGFDGEE